MSRLKSAARTLFTAFLLVAVSLPAWADNREPVTTADGVTGLAEVISTASDSVTVKFTRSGVEIESTMNSQQMDPISFYEVRRRHMESTAANHVSLAIHCAENGLFNQARFQMDMARALDPDVEQKIKDSPDVMEGIAAHLADAAKRNYDRGHLDTSYDLVRILATRFTETKAAERADEALDLLEKRLAERERDEHILRQKKIADARDAAARELAEKREAVVEGLEKDLTKARATESTALRQRNNTNAKRYHETAAEQYVKLIAAVDAAMTTAGEDKELVAMIRPVGAKARIEGADAYVNVGSMELARSNYDKADVQGRKALEIRPGHPRATSFLESVAIGREQADERRRLEDARERRSGSDPLR